MSSANRHPPASADVFHPRADESEFISAARLLMIAGLTFHHMFEIPNSRFYPRDSLAEFSYFVPDLLNGFVHMSFMAAVPILSVISGFLLFRRPELDFARLLRKRFFSVAVPAWVWSGLWLIVAYVMFRAGQGHGWFEWANYHFEAFDLKALANGIVGLDEYPFAFQFWFVHDLILTLALSPLIYWLLKTLDWPFLVLASLIWLSGVVPPPFYSLNVLYFFCLGAYLGRPSGPRLQDALMLLNRIGWYVVPVFSAALLARLFSHLLGEAGPMLHSYSYLCLLRVLGVLSFSQLLFTLVRHDGPVKRFLIRYSGYSFFIFAAHFPLIELVKVVAQRVPGSDSASGFFLMWLLIPLTTIALCIVGAKLLERLAPPVFNLLNGGRSAVAQPALARTLEHRYANAAS